jgi:hypothetical protein
MNSPLIRIALAAAILIGLILATLPIILPLLRQ